MRRGAVRALLLGLALAALCLLPAAGQAGEGKRRALEAKLLELVKAQGGSAGNIWLRRELGWDEDRYWRIRDGLVDAGRLVRGGGRGGSVRLTRTGRRVGDQPAERALYSPMKAVL